MPKSLPMFRHHQHLSPASEEVEAANGSGDHVPHSGEGTKTPPSPIAEKHPRRRRETAVPDVDAAEVARLPPWPDANDPLLGFCRPGCAIRPIDWRSRLGFALARMPRRKPSEGLRNDATLLRVRAFALAAFRGRDPLRVDPDLAAAWRLREDRTGTRDLVEALLIAGVDDAGIAAKTGLSEAVIAIFEPAFFAVRGAAVCFVAHAGGVSSPPPSDPDARHGWLLRVFGFTVGAEAVETLAGLDRIESGVATPAAIDAMVARQTKVKALAAALLMPLETPRDMRRALAVGDAARRCEHLEARARRAAR